MQIEASWALLNISNGNGNGIDAVVAAEALPELIRLLGSSSDDVKENCAWALGNIASGSVVNRDRVLDHDGTLACEDGKYYHEWNLNLKYEETGSFICPSRHSLKEFQTPSAGYGCDAGVDGCLDQGSDSEGFPVGTTLYGCRICNFDICSQCITTAKTEPKYFSTAPNIEGQDEDPGVPLGNGMCLRCHKPREQHNMGRDGAVVEALGKLATEDGLQIAVWAIAHLCM
jgi:hypothetical protein